MQDASVAAWPQVSFNFLTGDPRAVDTLDLTKPGRVIIVGCVRLQQCRAKVSECDIDRNLVIAPHGSRRDNPNEEITFLLLLTGERIGDIFLIAGRHYFRHRLRHSVSFFGVGFRINVRN
ncbi:hypothetical protein C3Y08_01770 [Burkholderia gladioli]|nr:hypothetical protein C3Y08_01770 [Burkholderia gladioli]